MKRISAVCFLLLALTFASMGLQKAFASELPEQVRVAFNFAYVLWQKDDAETLTTQQLENEEIATKVYFAQVLDVEGEVDNFFVVKLTYNQEIKSGYIYKAAVIDNLQKSPEKFLQTNATITKACTTFTLQNNNHTPTNFQLEKGTKVRLQQTISAKNKWTLISFNHEGQTLTHYVETKNIKPDGVSRAALTAIALLIVSASAAGVLIRIFKRKNKAVN